MPRLLLQRLRSHSVQEFRSAALERFRDAALLDGNERRLPAIYLFGYSVEMLLKAAYFRAIGYGVGTPILLRDLRDVIRTSPPGTFSGGNLHNLIGWRRRLIDERIARGTPISRRNVARLEQISLRLDLIWREYLRYHSNQAYPFESELLRLSVQWMLSHFPY